MFRIAIGRSLSWLAPSQSDGSQIILNGTGIGIAPIIAVTVIFLDRADAAINHPGANTFALLAVFTPILVGTAAYIWHRFGRSAQIDAAEASLSR